MLVPQFYARPFADLLIKEFAAAEHVDIATAWVRASGVGLLWKELKQHVAAGKRLLLVVGVDRDNTSIEGLELLTQLGAGAEVWVRHNESSAIFHPKLYAFRTLQDCRVFVGSNNLTGAGLTANEEVCGLLTDKRKGDLERSLIEYFQLLTDQKDGLAKKLDAKFVQELAAAGYITTEARLRGKAANQRKERKLSKRLFGSREPIRRKIQPAVPLSGPIEPDLKAPIESWNRVFVRLRLARGTQSQLPVPIVREVRRRLGEAEVDGPIDVIIHNNNSVRRISPTYAARNPGAANTYKFEVFQPKGEAIIKLELVGSTVIVEQFDTADTAGKVIEGFIQDGLKTSPPLTLATTSDLNSATLYRYD